MKITTLIENRDGIADGEHLKGEWGLSLHIAFNGHHILFDTGASGAFADNARKLSVDLSAVDAVVLSHHHYDHGGGLKRFLQINPCAEVYMAKAPDGKCCARAFGLFTKYIGLDYAALSGFGRQFQAVEKPVEILPRVHLLPCIEGSHPRPQGNRRLYLKKDGRLLPDAFSHELVMAIEEHGELVVFTGCSHNGLLNMLDTIAAAFPGIAVKAVIGGFHLVSSPLFNRMAGSRQQVEAFGKAVLKHPVGVAYTGHCTGAQAFDVLQSVMGERIVDMRTGSRFDV